MPNRVLRDWTTSETVDKLSQGAEVFFTRLIMKADDFGNYTANTKLLKAALFPLKDYTEYDINDWLSECINVGIIVKYTVDNKDYTNIPNFDQRLRAMKSRFPVNRLTDDSQPTDKGRLETKRNETESETKGKDIYIHNYVFNLSFALLTNAPYLPPKERAMNPIGRNVDELIQQLKNKGYTEEEIMTRTKAMRAIYAKGGSTFPLLPETFIKSFEAKDWVKELQGQDPERQAEQFQKTLNHANKRQPEPDTIGTSAPGSLG